MARNSRRSRGMKKLEPSAQTFTLQWTAPAGQNTKQYADLSQIASLVNRRFYRQGLNWMVSGMKLITTTLAGTPVTGNVVVSKLPESWIMSNAWEKSFRAWMRMNNEALEENESIRPKFLDFKIYADDDHHHVGFAANLLPRIVGHTATPGAWESSKFRVPDTSAASGGTQNREIIAVGPSYQGPSPATGFNAVSCISGYATSRALPDVLDPNVPADAADADGQFPDNWLAALFNEGTQQTEDVLDDMITENVIAPYPFENDGVHLDTMYPGGETQLPGLQIHDIIQISPTTLGQTSYVKGGSFPCGLIKIANNNSSDDDHLCTLLIDLVPGNHRGYLATSMTEM